LSETHDARDYSSSAFNKSAWSESHSHVIESHHPGGESRSMSNTLTQGKTVETDADARLDALTREARAAVATERARVDALVLAFQEEQDSQFRQFELKVEVGGASCFFLLPVEITRRRQSRSEIVASND
jgi:hypothetical protein